MDDISLLVLLKEGKVISMISISLLIMNNTVKILDEMSPAKISYIFL